MARALALAPQAMRALNDVQRVRESPPESAIFFAFSRSFASTSLRSSRRLENTNLPQTREKLGMLFALIFRISVSYSYLPCTAARSNQPSEDSHEPATTRDDLIRYHPKQRLNSSRRLLQRQMALKEATCGSHGPCCQPVRRTCRLALYSLTARLPRHCPSLPFCARSRPRLAAIFKPLSESASAAGAGSGTR